MKRTIKALIYQKPIQEFREKFPGLLNKAKLPSTDKPLSELADLTSLPREHLLMDNLLPLLETPPAQRIAILEALKEINKLDVNNNYDAVTRHAMPIFGWLNDKKDILREAISVPYSGNPYIYRQLWAFTFTLKNKDNCRAGVEAYTLSYPLKATMVQFTDGYDPVRYQFYEPLGELFEDLVTLIAEGLESSVIIDQTYQIPVDSIYQGKSGRPSNQVDDWAYQQIRNGRDQYKVYDEWLKKIDPVRKENLADPQDTFKKAMRNRRRREEKRE